MSTADTNAPPSCSVCGRVTHFFDSTGRTPLCRPCHRRMLEKTQVLDPSEDSNGFPILPKSKVQLGDLLAGRFTVLQFLGRGGMGEVFEARDNVLEEHVALKIVHANKTTSEASLRRLRREVQLARRVTHNNVCRIFDLTQHHDAENGLVLDLVSMELLEGETLRDCLNTKGRLTVEEALPIVRQIARGLVAAHRLGIVHRDLKPANVMLVEEASGLRAAITDFGLAHSVGPEGRNDKKLTQDGDLIGSPAYMAPEQAGGDPTSAATDIYSLGVMLYEMLAGVLPFSGSSAWLMMVDRLTGDPVPLEKHLPDLDPRILKMVSCCLQRSPQHRFASTSDILEILDLGDSTWEVYGSKTLPGSGPEANRPTLTPPPEPTPATAAPLFSPAQSAESHSVQADQRSPPKWIFGLILALIILVIIAILL